MAKLAASDWKRFDRAFQNVTSSDATLAQIGWVDSDNDGVFDVLDVPLKLEGFGQLNASGTEYSFLGRASVQTVPNVNSSGLQNDITLNRISRIEYRFNNGNWQTIQSPNEYVVDFDLRITVPTGTTGTVEIRALDSATGSTSNVFSGTLGLTRDTAAAPGIGGFVWADQNLDGAWQFSETGVANARVRLVDNNRQPIVLQNQIEPDSFQEGQIPANQNGVLVEAIGDDTNGTVGAFTDAGATTGSKVFRPYSPSQIGFVDGFRGEQQQLRLTFAQKTTSVSIDAIAGNNNTIARLEAYNSDGKLIRRFQSAALNVGQSVHMQVGFDTPEIAYVIARGFRNSKIKLDNLVIGPATETKSSANGAYFLPGIPSGTYQAEITPPSATYEVLQPATGLRTMSVIAGSPNTHVDFTLRNIASQWQNQTQRQDVNNDGLVTLLDVLVIINEINRNGARPLENSTLVPPPFYDVDGNRSIEALDVLIVINFINSTQGNGEGESIFLDEIYSPGSGDWVGRKRRKA